MPPLDEIKNYSATVCEQIRWKKAHSGIAQEIEDHLCDQRDYYRSQGEEEEAATQKAILQMGDAVRVGMALDKTHKPKPQWALILLTIGLMLIGAGVGYWSDGSELSMKSFSMVPYIIAILIFFTAYFLDFTALAKYPRFCYFFTLLISIIGLILSTEVNGRPWIFFARFGVSLSYLALIFPLAYSLLIYAMRDKGSRGLLLCAIGYMPYVTILLAASSAAGFVLYTFSALTLLLTAISKGWFGNSKRKGMLIVLIPTALAAVSMIIIFLLQPYQFERIRVLLDPASYPNGYQMVLIRDMISGAVFAGRGSVPQQYGSNVLSMSWFDTDLVLTALTHTYGWVAFFGITLLFTIFSVIGFRYVSRQRSVLGLMVSRSILLIFITQTVLYILSNLGYGLLTGFTLPLVSYGKAALFINAGLIGFMLSVFRTGDAVRDGYHPQTTSSPFVTYEKGKLIINLKG